VRRLIVQRLLQLPIVVLGVTFAAFLIVNLLPGNLGVYILGENASRAQIIAIDHQLGLNRPLLVRYWEWMWSALHGNLGNSYTTSVPVTQEISRVLAPTIELIVYGFVISLVLSISLAFWSVWTRSRLLDRLITSATLAAHSLPAFVLALFLLYVFAVKLGWIPTIPYHPFSQGVLSNIGYMFFPAFTLSVLLFPTQMRVLRGDLLVQFEREEYVSLAWLKGLSKGQVIFRHVAKNGAAGFVTILGLQLGFLFAGVVLIEQVFTISGVGELLLTAIQTHDVTTVQGILVIVSVLVVAANLLADIAYVLLDPRVKYS